MQSITYALAQQRQHGDCIILRFTLGIVRPGRGASPSPPSRAEVKNRVELYLYFPQGPLWPMTEGNLPTLGIIFKILKNYSALCIIFSTVYIWPSYVLFLSVDDLSTAYLSSLF